MVIETYEDIPNATDEEVLKFLREQIFVVLKKADMNRRIFVACFDTIISEIGKRLVTLHNIKETLEKSLGVG